MYEFNVVGSLVQLLGRAYQLLKYQIRRTSTNALPATTNDSFGSE